MNARSLTRKAIETTTDGLFVFASVGLDASKPQSLVDNGFYCWVEGSSAPKTRHASEGIARSEAARLATLNPGKKVHIMRHEFVSLDFAVSDNVRWGSNS
jgi:hypothetical protein